jgi:hypothetical protein
VDSVYEVRRKMDWYKQMKNFVLRC